MDMSQGLSKDFKNELVNYFKRTRGTKRWKKHEIIEAIKDIWISWLEESMPDIKSYREKEVTR